MMERYILVQKHVATDGIGGGNNSSNHLVPVTHPFGSLLLQGGSLKRGQHMKTYKISMWEPYVKTWEPGPLEGDIHYPQTSGWRRVNKRCPSAYGKTCEEHEQLFQEVKDWLLGKVLYGVSDTECKHVPGLPSIKSGIFDHPTELVGSVSFGFNDWDPPAESIFSAHMSRMRARSRATPDQLKRLDEEPSLADRVLSCTKDEVQQILEADKRRRACLVKSLLASIEAEC